MFRHLQQVQNAKESRFSRQLSSNIRKPYRFNRIDFNLAFLHAVSRAHSDARTHPNPHTASDFPASYTLAKPFSEHHEESLRPTLQPAYFCETMAWRQMSLDRWLLSVYSLVCISVRFHTVSASFLLAFLLYR